MADQIDGRWSPTDAGPLGRHRPPVRQPRHVLDRDFDRELQRLLRAGVDDGHRPVADLALMGGEFVGDFGLGVGGLAALRRRALDAAEEAGHFVERPLRGGQPDALQAGRRSQSAASRSIDNIRWAPRLVGTSAWISSMMTVSIERSASRAFEVRSRYSDSGVVIRMSAGSRWNRARSLCGVSPVRMAIAGVTNESPRRSATCGDARSAARAGCAPRRPRAP